MATEEAKALLDHLMGSDRNASLPKGAAIPLSGNRNKRSTGGGGSLVLPGKRHKSCYDKDIDPLYTAWGIDVYELFVNTKSDLGTNPYIVDEGAHKEFKALPVAEQDTLGYYYFLYQKLLELVRQCDRIVNRNKEKLKQELNRKLSQRGGQDFVEDVDDGAVEHIAPAIIQLENLNVELNDKLSTLNEFVMKEDDDKRLLEPLLEKVHKQKSKQLKIETATINTEETDTANNEEGNEGDPTPTVTAKVKIEADEQQKENDDEDSNEKQRENGSNSEGLEFTEQDRIELDRIQMELGNLTLQKQRILYDIAKLFTQIIPLQENVETQRRQLNYVRSDISTDKTVCDVSGNFMSARDADERIAAHYAGKQYVGWKLVRDKLKSMTKQYGPYGPPPPGPRGGGGGGPMRDNGPSPMMMSRPSPMGGGGDRGGGRGSRDRRDGGGGYRGGAPPDRRGGGGGGGPPDRGGGGGGPPDRGGGGGGPPDRGRWERGAPPQGYNNDRRGGPPPRGDWRR